MNKTKVAMLSTMVLFMSLLLAAANSWAAGVKVVPSSARVEPGESFSVEIMAEGIPSEGLGSVQFRLNVVADGAVVSGVNDLGQATSADVSVSTPLLISAPTASRSGLGPMFLNGQGNNGILVLDNESFENGSALFTYAHTKDSIRSDGSGSVARFMFKVGELVGAEQIRIFLTDVLLLDGGPAYPLDYNEEGVVTLRCTTPMPSLLGLSLDESIQILTDNALVVGNVYEIDNPGNSHPLDVVLEQAIIAGGEVDCESSIDLAVNVAPGEVTSAGAVDRTGDDSGQVILSWTPPTAADTAGYRIYLGADLLADVRPPQATSAQVDGLAVGVEQSLRISAYDTFGNESVGVVITALAIDDVDPIITLSGVVDGAHYNGAVTPQLTVDDTNPGSQSLTLNGSSYSAGTAIIEENTYTLTATAIDTAGNTTTQSISFTIDLTAPVIIPQNVVQGGFYNGDLIPNLTIDDLHLNEALTTYLLNGQPYVPGTPITQEGAYTLTATAVDMAGNSTSLMINFVLDRTAPVSAAETGTPQFSSDGTLYITGQTLISLTSSDNGSVASGVADIAYRVDGADSWIDYSAPFALEGLIEGTNLLTYRATDSAGNQEADKTLEFVIDNSAPETTITIGSLQAVGSDGIIYVGGATEFSLSAIDSFSGIASTEYRLDNTTWLAYAPFTLVGLSDGAHTIGYRSTDQLGNVEAELTLAVMVDNAAPVTEISIGSPQTVGDGTLYVGGATEFTLSVIDTSSGVATTEYRLDNGNWLIYTPFNLAGLLDGAHTIGYRSTDQLGNVESDLSLTVVVDNTAPITTITTGDPKYIGTDTTMYVVRETEFTLSATDVFSGVATTEYRIDSGSWTAYAPLNLAGLADGGHTIGYRSTDNLGNVEDELSLAVIVDNTAPVTEITSDDPKHTAADGILYVGGSTVFSLSAFDSFSGVATTEYRLDSGNWLAYTPFNLAGLADSAHTIAFRSIDQLGNIETEQTLAVMVDNAAPVTEISIGSPQTVGDGTLYVGGATEFTLSAIDTSSGVATTEYRLDNGSWVAYAPFNLAGLADGAHTIAFRSIDQLGNIETEQTLAVMVDNAAPVTEISIGSPQTVGDGTLYVGGATEFTLSAIDTSSGVATTEYRLDNGSWVAYAPFNLAGLADGAHTIVFRSIDQLGNIEIEQTLAVVADNTAPVTTITTGDPKYIGTDTTMYVVGATEFTLSATDVFSGIAAIEYRIDSGSWTAYAPLNLAGLADGGHTIGYRSTDQLGNVAAEQSYSVVLDNKPPVTGVKFNSKSFEGNDSTYLSKVTQVIVSAIDPLSGVNTSYYRFDDQINWRTYDSPFRLENLSFGDHLIHFYSVDNLTNTESVRSVAFTLVGVEVSTGILNLPRVLVWTEDPDGLHGKNRPAYDRDDLLLLFEEALGVPDIYLGVVTDKDEFKSELRSGIYNMAMVINQDTPFDAGFLGEMREAVNRGMGLLVSSWGNNVHPIWQDLFGIDFSGSLPMNESKRELFLSESPIGLEQTLIAEGRMLKMALDGGELAGVVAEEGLPAVVLGEYGQGRTAFFAYNIIESALSGELAEHASLLRNGASYLLPQEARSDAGGIALFETRIKLRGSSMDVLAVEKLGEGLIYLPLFDLVEERLEYQFRFEDGGEAVYRYFVNIPDQGGEYFKETEVSFGLDGSYVPYDVYTHAFMVEPDSDGLQVQAINLLDDYGGQYPASVDELAVIADRLAGLTDMPRTSLKECEQVIRHLVQCVQQVEKLPFDSSDLRVLLGEYLRVVEGEAALY
ncbi:MAG: hypothetical protein ABFS18_01490 [Thermodesulfobacteriota bacterium]